MNVRWAHVEFGGVEVRSASQGRRQQGVLSAAAR